MKQVYQAIISILRILEFLAIVAFGISFAMGPISLGVFLINDFSMPIIKISTWAGFLVLTFASFLILWALEELAKAMRASHIGSPIEREES